MSEGILATVLIVAIVTGAACYAIRRLDKKAGRIAAVIIALSILVAALVPVIKILVEGPPPPPLPAAASGAGPARLGSHDDLGAPTHSLSVEAASGAFTGSWGAISW